MSDAAAAASTSSDDMVAQFLAFTGSADPARAQSYLEMSGGDLQTAVSLYLEHQGGGGGGMGGGLAGPPEGGGGGGAVADMGADAALGGGGDEGMLGDDIRAPDRTRTMRLMDFDEGSHPGAGAAAALARSGMLGQQAAAMMGAAAAMGMPLDEEAGAMMSAFASDAAAASSSSAPGSGGAPDVRAAINRAAAAAASAGETKSDDLDDDDDGESSGGRPSPPPSGGGRTTNLSEMFAPPTHLMHTAGGFQGARNVARDARRWLLVNLNRDSDFACHALNRDVWRDELVENLVKEGFIFWQSTDVSADGSTYAQRYSVHTYPHVAIIDPRTGRLMWKREGWTQVDPMTAEQFAELAADFCSRHSFDRPPVAPRPTSSTSASAVAASSSNGPSGASAAAAAKKRPMREMTEEEQLQAAIQASMQNDDDDNMEEASDDEVVMEDSDEDEYEYDAGDVEAEVAPPPAVAAAAVPLGAVGRDEPQQPAKKKQEEAKEKEEEAKEEEVKTPPSFEEELLNVEVGDEPKDGDVARVQIRMPDGKRLVRKFRGDDTVRVIYAFVAQSGGEGARPFELKAGFPPRDIRPKVDETIKGCGLAGEAITVRWTS